jgi:Tfp pilus assembly protein PilF
MLGFSYASLSYIGYAPPKELMHKAKVAYDQALKINDQLAEAHAYMASYKHIFEWDHDGAEQGYRRAIDLNPNSPDVHHQYAMFLTFAGRFEQAISEIRKAEDLDPTSIFTSRNVSQVLYFARRYDEAIEQSRRAIDLNPNSGPVYSWIIRALEMKGDEKRTFATYLKQAEANGARSDEIAGMKAAYAADGLKGYWRRMLNRMLLLEKSELVVQVDVAELYAQLGEREQALVRLQKAVDERDYYAVSLKVEPLWDSYRTDPRFIALVRRVGLTP